MNNKLKYKKKVNWNTINIHVQAAPPIWKHRIWKKKKTIQFEVSVELYCYKQSRFWNTDIEVVAIFHIY